MEPRRSRFSSSLTVAIAFLAVLIGSGTALGQETGRITGRVLHGETGDPLSYADVMLLGTGLGSATNAQGEYFINFVPAGAHTIQASFIGFDNRRLEVLVEADRTTEINFRMRVKPLEMDDELVVYADREPLVQPDRTGSAHEQNRDELDVLPIISVAEAISDQGGVVTENGEIHVRGGRSTEVKWFIDDIAITDPASGLMSLEVGMSALTGYELLSGGFDAEYGNVQSGVINLQTKEGGTKFSGELLYMTDDYGAPERTYDNFDMLAFGLGGPFFTEKFRYYVSGQTSFTDGYIPTTEERPERDVLGGLLGISARDRQSALGSGQVKLSFIPEPGRKLTFEYLLSEVASDPYRHSFSRSGHWSVEHQDWSHVALDSSYHFYNAGEHTATEWTRFSASKLVWRDRFGPEFLYTVRLARLESQNRTCVYEDPNDYWWQAYVGGRRATDPDSDNDLNREPGYFRVWGDDLTWSESRTRVTTLKADATKTAGEMHRIKSGLELVYNELLMKELNLGSLIPSEGDTLDPGFQFFDWDRAHDSPERFQHNIYTGFPVEGAIYVQDRMDYEGMIVRGGLRLDWLDPGAGSGEGEHRIWRERLKAVLSPRLGIAHPISDRDALHFHYGRFYQIPHLSVLYASGENLEDVPAGRIVGYSGLEPEVTTAYQFGAQHQFSENVAVDIAGFYRDIFGLLATEEYSRGPTEGSVFPYVNKDYASVKGVEFKLTKRFSNHFMGNLTYTLLQATGVSSDENQGAQAEAAGLPRQPLKEIPLKWDERHGVSGFLFVSDPGNWEITFDYNYGSGLPYTPRTLGQKGIDPESIYSGRRPSHQLLNLKGRKRYKLYGQEFSLFFEAMNVFDKRNPLTLGVYGSEYYTMTGGLGGAYIETDADGREGLEPLNDPSTFEEGRLIRVGINVNW
ncbi:MAG: TonB-dependent receptor [Candidatus Eisenbacteria sp.]|nr:TonB-dependent receptor [Candidatus Eisenbacteria bacterium]